MRPRSWWIDRFAERGFAALTPEFDAGFVAAHAMRFRIGPATTPLLDALLVQRSELLQASDRLFATTSRSREHGLKNELDATRQRVDRTDVGEPRRSRQDGRAKQQTDRPSRGRAGTPCAARLWRSSRQDIGAPKTRSSPTTGSSPTSASSVEELQGLKLAILHRNAEDKDKLIAGLNYHLLAVQRTIGWKLLERLRRLRDALLPVDSRRRDVYWSIRRPIEVLLDEGLRAFFFKTRYKVRLRWRGQEFARQGAARRSCPPDTLDARYQAWIERHRVGPHDVARMKAAIARWPIHAR